MLLKAKLADVSETGDKAAAEIKSVFKAKNIADGVSPRMAVRDFAKSRVARHGIKSWKLNAQVWKREKNK